MKWVHIMGDIVAVLDNVFDHFVNVFGCLIVAMECLIFLRVLQIREADVGCSELPMEVQVGVEMRSPIFVGLL